MSSTAGTTALDATSLDATALDATALDATAATDPLAEAAARMSRLLPTRSSQPADAGVLIRADGSGLLLVASDGELTVRSRVPATTHEAGEAVVSRRGLTDTVAALDAPEVRLVVEGARLAVRVPGARFALPRWDGAKPVPTRLPDAVGAVGGAHLRAAAVSVAGAASREHALPVFTGVRLRSHDGRLSLLATDRYRLASASVAWRPLGAADGVDATADLDVRADDTSAAELDVLVPAGLFAEAARQAGRAGTVVIHGDGDLFALAWDGGSIVTSTLGAPFPDAQVDRLLDVDPECTVEVEADALASAVDRASRYAGPHGRVAVQAIDGALLVRASDAISGESEETVKAAVRGGHVTRVYQAKFLSDALRPSARHTVRMRIQAGLRATEFTAVSGTTPDVDLRYMIVPMAPGNSGGDAA